MALWLFRRKSRRKWSRPGSLAYPSSPHPRSLNTPEAVAHATTLQNRPSYSRKQRPEPNKLRRRARVRSYSFDLGQADALNLSSAAHRHNAAATAAVSQPGAMMPDRMPTLHHTQTSKRDGHHLVPRTKSSKRRKNVHDRERAAEIKALSHPSNHGGANQFASLRPAVEQGSAGRPVRLEALAAPESIDMAMSSDSDDGGAFTISPFAALAPKPTLRYAPQQPRGPPTSAGPPPKRLPSKKRMLSVQIPEATIKAHKRIDDLADDMDAGDLRELMERDKRRRERHHLREQERTEQRLARLAERQRRLDAQEASGGAGASDRSEVRSSTDLARGVLGREAVGPTVVSTTSAVVTSSIIRRAPPQAIPTPRDSLEQQVEAQPQPPQSDPLPVAVADADNTPNNGNPDNETDQRASPVETFHRPDSAPMEPADVQPPADAAERNAVQEDKAQPQNVTAVPVRTDSTIRKLMKLRKRLSKSSSLADRVSSNSSFTRSQASVIREVSDDGTPGRRLSWGTLGVIFRWRSRSKRASGHSTPVVSSFSNVSRGSVMAQPPPKRPYRRPQPLHSAAHAFQVSQTSQVSWVSHASQASHTLHMHAATANQDASGLAHPMRATGNIPKRALSRFREDLPDYLISPPASRSASPEAEREAQEPQTGQPQDQTAQPAQEHESFETAQPTFGRSRSLLFDGADEGYRHDRDDDSIILTPVVFHPQQQKETEAVPSSYGGSTSGDNSVSNGTRNMSTPWLLMDGTEPSPEPQQSLSLASIDSEGSWLSGRHGGSRRRLAQPQRSLDSVSRSYEQQPRSVGMTVLGTTPDDEDMAGMLADDEYLRRYATNSTGLDARLGLHRCESSGVTRPSSDEDMDVDMGMDTDTDTDDSHGNSSDREEARWGTVSKGRVAAVVAPGGCVSRPVKSHEGLLNNYYDGEACGVSGSEDSLGSPVSPVSPVSLVSPVSPVSATSQTSQTSSQFEAQTQRATSVNLGRGHVRHISAGSAKLLNLSPRNSVDAKAHVREPLI